jgi:hypothetical protein
MIQLFIGAAIGALVVIASKRTRREVSMKALTGYRMPHTNVTVVLPKTIEDLQRIDEALCYCLSQLEPQLPTLEQAGHIAPAPAAGDDEHLALRKLQARADSIATWVQSCAASDLYPEDISWPPQVGDHPTIHALWGILDYRVRRLLLRGEPLELCPTAGQESTP